MKAEPRSPGWVRVFGLATLAYGGYTLARPESLLRAAGLTGHRARGVAVGIGVRDTLSGASLLLAPAGPARTAALGVRLACDLADIVGFGIACPPRTKATAMAIAGGWAALGAGLLRVGR